MTAGYSGTPLAKKLGIKAGSRVAAVHAPGNYQSLLAPLPDDVQFAARVTNSTDLVHVFARKQSELRRALTAYRKAIAPAAAVWVSWPKKTSGVETDITEDSIRNIALPLGFVDVKVCAVDEVWSGLKLVIRKQLRRQS